MDKENVDRNLQSVINGTAEGSAGTQAPTTPAAPPPSTVPPSTAENKNPTDVSSLVTGQTKNGKEEEEVDLNEFLEEQKKKEVSFSDKAFQFLQFYFIPILSFVVFIIFLLFPIRIQIGSILSGLDEVEIKNSEVERLNNELNSLLFLSSTESSLQQDIDVLNTIAPTSEVEVIDFSTEIEQVASQFNINFANKGVVERERNQTSSNPIEDTETTLDFLRLKEVPTQFEISGTFDQIVSYLEALEEIDDFLVFTEFDFSKSSIAANSDWALTVTIVKYQFQDTDEAAAQAAYQQIPSNIPINPLVQQYLDDRRE